MTTLVGALLIGATLGLLGSGGSAITVPILVYLIGHDAKVSIAESMAIVGAISFAGAVPKALSNHVDWKSVVWFGVPAMAGTYIGAWLGGLATDALQLTTFGVVLILAAILMLRKAFGNSAKENQVDEVDDRRPFNLLCVTKITCEGVFVGILTGFVGVGGGFLIVPALLVLEKLPIKTAIGTSLVIIAFKSAIGFGKYHFILAQQGLTVDTQTIVAFVLIGIGGCAIGQRLNASMNQKSLKKVFAIFLVIIGAFVIVREGGKLWERQTVKTGIILQKKSVRARICREPYFAFGSSNDLQLRNSKSGFVQTRWSIRRAVTTQTEGKRIHETAKFTNHRTGSF